MISVTYLLFFSINSVEYLSVLTSVRLVHGCLFPFIYITLGDTTKHDA